MKLFELKHSIFIFLFVSVLGMSAQRAQDVTVDFEGRVTNENETLSEVIVQVLQNGKLMTSFKTDNNGTYNVYLPLGHEYLISISKNNYVQKYFSVSTKGVPSEDAMTKFPTITADVDLFKYYDGVDYSLFNEPINKFYYNSKKGNFEYDKQLLKEKKEAMKRVKEQERRAILALQKKNKNAVPVAKSEINQHKTENAQQTSVGLMSKLSNEEKSLFNNEKKNEEFKINLVAADNTASQKIIENKVNSLVNKYKQGVTEERKEGDGIIIITRVLVKDETAWVYEKKIFNWGGVAYFRDKQRITASTFAMETNGK